MALDPNSPHLSLNGEVLVGMVNGYLFKRQFDYSTSELTDFIQKLPISKEKKMMVWVNLKNR